MIKNKKYSLKELTSMLEGRAKETSIDPRYIVPTYIEAEIHLVAKIAVSTIEEIETRERLPGYEVDIEVPSPTDDNDSILLGNFEKNITSLVIDGIETATPYITLDDIIQSFKIDPYKRIWTLFESATEQKEDN